MLIGVSFIEGQNNIVITSIIKLVSPYDKEKNKIFPGGSTQMEDGKDRLRRVRRLGGLGFPFNSFASSFPTHLCMMGTFWSTECKLYLICSGF